MNRRVCDALPGRESVARIVRFRGESSQIRNRAYTRAPRKRTEISFTVGRAFVIGTDGAAIEDGFDSAEPEPLAFFAVTSTRSRKPTSALRTP